jgi:hypothetical protein
MEKYNIVFKQQTDSLSVVAFVSTLKQRQILEALLNTHNITFQDSGFGKLILENENQCEWVTAEKINIEASLETIENILNGAGAKIMFSC